MASDSKNSNCHVNVNDNVNDNDIIKEPKEKFIKMDDYTKHNVDDLCKSYVTGPDYQAVREALCMSRRITPDQLTKFCQQFTMHLKSTAKMETHMREFITHFNNWLHKQDLSQKPQTVQAQQDDWQKQIERNKQRLFGLRKGST